jgi:hypothetical protein
MQVVRALHGSLPPRVQLEPRVQLGVYCSGCIYDQAQCYKLQTSAGPSRRTKAGILEVWGEEVATVTLQGAG